MRSVIICFCLLAFRGISQQNGTPYTFDPLSFGVVMDHPDMKKVKLLADVNYLKDEKRSLHMDVYLPPDLKKGEQRPAIVFLNAIGDQPGNAKVKSWGIYSSWPRLIAAYGYVGISMEADRTDIQLSVQSIFEFISKNSAAYHIDADRLGVYAASANVTESSKYLMGSRAFPGIKAAVLYYGQVPQGPYRKDLPVYFMVSEGDVRPQFYDGLWGEVLKNNAPWTVRMGTGMPHAFDAFWDRDDSRKILRETISFWQNHLDPVPKPSWGEPDKTREALGLQRANEPKALELLQSLAKEHPEEIPLVAFYAQSLNRANRYPEAEINFKKVLKQEPKNEQALTGLYVALISQNKKEEAEAYLGQARQAGPLSRDVYANLGFSMLVAGKDREAAQFYESALAIEPRAIDYYNMACAYAKYNEKTKALDALEKAMQLGYNSRAQYEGDSDLNSVRSESRYKALLEKAE